MGMYIYVYGNVYICVWDCVYKCMGMYDKSIYSAIEWGERSPEINTHMGIYIYVYGNVRLIVYGNV